MCTLLATNAWADPTVTFNGIDVTGLQNQKFNNVNIEFDAKGNIILTAPQYKLVNTAPQTPTPNTQTPTQQADSALTTTANSHNTPTANSHNTPTANSHNMPQDLPVVPDNGQPTYLMAIFNAPGLLGYNVDIYVNGNFAKTLDQGKELQTLDISKYLVKGKNTLQYRLIMAADSGTSSTATVVISLAKMTKQQGKTVELSGEYADTYIKGTDGAQTYTVEFNFQ
jgi:hypothetical protein